MHQLHSFLFQRLTVILFIFCLTLSWNVFQTGVIRVQNMVKWHERRVEERIELNKGENYIQPVWDQEHSPPCSVVHFTQNSWAACGKQDCTFIPALAVLHDLLNTDVLKARSESEASFFRRSVTKREGEYGSDCKPSTLPILHEAACLPSCSHLARACSWSPRWLWHVSAGCWAEIHHQAGKGTRGSCHVAHGSGAAVSYVKDIILNSSAFSF